MLKALRLALCLLLLSCFVVAGAAAPVLPAVIAETAFLAETDSHFKDTSAFPVAAAIASKETSLQPGHPFMVAIHLKLDKGWHLYWKNPGDAGMAPQVKWKLPPGFTAGEIVWPTPKRFTVDSAVGFGYEDEVALLAEIIPPDTIKDKEAPIAAQLEWVVCSDSTCLPGSADVAMALPVKDALPKNETLHAALFSIEKLPKKGALVTVLRTNGHLEVRFKDRTSIPEVNYAEFFSAEPDAIDHTVPATMKQMAVILTESQPKNSLNGVMVLHTPTGSDAYDIAAPIENALVAFADAPAQKLGTALPGNAITFEGGVMLAIALAFVGGMILNLMPCVLPVVSFKVLSFIKLAGQKRSHIFRHGLAFTGGVLLSFWVLAAALLIMQAYGRSVGWGFQLQEPLFVAALAAFIFVFSLSLFGLFEFGTSIMSKAGAIQQHSAERHHELLGSFINGVLATAVATPCTGPFLGSAVGYAVTLPSLQAMLIFTSLGLGMSSPYIAMTLFPSLLKLMPRPGNWMVTFKEAMGFLMVACVLWLVWVFGAQTGAFSTILLLGGLFFLAVACWIYGRWGAPHKRKLTRRIGILGALAFFVLGSYAIINAPSTWAQKMEDNSTIALAKVTDPKSTKGWEEFSPERLEELRAKGIPVFIDFTAKWCLICQANHLVLTSQEVAKKFEEHGVVTMKADWTKHDETIANEMRKYGRNSVPLYLLFDVDPSLPPQILPQVLTPEAVNDALNKLSIRT